MWIAAIIALLVVIVALFVASKGRYYRRLFSVESFREFHHSLSQAIETAQRKDASQPPSQADGTAFVTSAGLGVGATCIREADGIQTLHISLSQPGRATTHSVCSRFGYFAIAMLGETKAKLSPYFTDSGVHHLHFRLEADPIHLQDFDSSYARFLSEHKPIPFRHEQENGEQGAAAPHTR